MTRPRMIAPTPPPLSTHPPTASALWPTFLRPVLAANTYSLRRSPDGHIHSKSDSRFFVGRLQFGHQAGFL
ncbi:hypothetical protein [Microcoleus sp. Pol12A5]|uniref:hypothetical protein n=1 Tax=Microcoleus sp. Pol12A5 TaxID=3055392 RepID=UPI002FD25DB9